MYLVFSGQRDDFWLKEEVKCFFQVADSGRRQPELEDYGYVPEEVHEIFDLNMYDEELL